jgi:hypothetical protein
MIFRVVPEQPVKPVPDISTYVFEKESYAQHCSNNGLHQVTSTSGIYVKKVLYHEKYERLV